jgi:glutathione S-transferase
MTLNLVSHHLCPYVQRVAIALDEKRVAFERLYIDLAAKPAWFTAMSPLGKVPLLQLGDDVLFESAAICEYLEDAYPENPLHPATPLQRAKHRGWMEFASAVLGDVWGFETAKDESTTYRKAADLRMKFQQLEKELGSGPFFAGTAFSLVDAAFAPVFRYFDVFDAIADFGIFENLHRIRAWRTALAQRASVQAAVTSDYADRLHIFLAKHQAYLYQLATKDNGDMAAAKRGSA